MWRQPRSVHMDARQHASISKSAQMKQISVASVEPPLLSVRRLRVMVRRRRFFPGVRPTRTHVIENLDLDLGHGETLGVIGESGCGKTILARAIMGVQAVASGSVRVSSHEGHAHNTTSGVRRTLSLIDGRPRGRPRPRSCLGQTLARELNKLFPDWTSQRCADAIAESLERVGFVGNGGERSWSSLSADEVARAAIAFAIAGQPRVLVCDEPTAGLDPRVAIEVLDLLQRLKREDNMAMLLLTAQPHLAIRVSDRLVSLYLGRVMEQGECEPVSASPAHPYTRALLACAPDVESDAIRLRLPGALPDPFVPPLGCVFHPRCPMAEVSCVRVTPYLRRTGAWPRHYAACLFAPSP